ncbi:FMN-binding protein [Enterococcus sp. AZ196]|uniref:FMN-binding protein n=1 Tax=Enterococcus sp. AZ196 TaxID=2774659 RepID=UPI003D2CD766
MKKLITIFLVIVVLILCVKIGASILTKNTLRKVKINEIDLSRVTDGEYEGAATIKPVSVKVNVLVEDGKIATIRMVDHVTGLGKNGEKIVDKIIGEQSLDVDAISGATQSSVTIMKAVEDALSKNN